MLLSALMIAATYPEFSQEPAPKPSVEENAPSSIPYTYITLGYEQMSVDGWDDDPSGPFVSGSYGFDPNWHGFAGYSTASGDVAGIDVDQDVISLGIGYHHTMAPKTDLVISAAFLRAKLSSDALGASETLDGHSIGVGIRALVGERIELSGGVAFVDYEELDSDSVFGVSGFFYASRNVALGLGLSTSNDADSVSVAIRWVP